MGNCNCVCKQTSEDEAADALLNGFDGGDNSRPRGPPPPYQVEAPLYAMTEEQRIQLVQRVTMIQCLPLGRYDGDKKKDKELRLEECEEVQGSEKKGEKNRECPICMMDFAEGEHIRLLPCMHFYHMRCIDDWLMRSYSCPTCMQRVDIGMRNTLISSSSSSAPSSQAGLRRRRRRRRREERGSSSSITSSSAVAASGSVSQQHHHHHGAEGYSKRTEGVESQYYPEGKGTYPPSPPPPPPPQGSHQEEHVSADLGLHFEDGSPTAGQTISEHYSGQSVSSRGHHHNHSRDEISSGWSHEASGCDHEVQLLGFEVQQDEVLDRTNHTAIGGFQALSQGIGHLSPPVSPPSAMCGHGSSERGAVAAVSPGMLSRPFSPPVFEYHFDYPSSPSSAGHFMHQNN